MKSLKEMSAEVEDFERDKGWLDQQFTFGERMALLHSEVSEALEAWREWGVEDATNYDHPVMNPNPKPEGVGSEFADIFIRLVGDARRDGVDLQAEMDGFTGLFAISVAFGEQMNALHHLICIASMAGQDEFGIFGTVGSAYTKVYVFLTQLCEYHGIDLEAEYERKMAYNRERPYRHGGKRI
jgi:NTP pyrophosphatase (non-canonical NTP hydrolase)